MSCSLPEVASAEVAALSLSLIGVCVQHRMRAIKTTLSHRVDARVHCMVQARPEWSPNESGA